MRGRGFLFFLFPKVIVESVIETKKKRTVFQCWMNMQGLIFSLKDFHSTDTRDVPLDECFYNGLERLCYGSVLSMCMFL